MRADAEHREVEAAGSGDVALAACGLLTPARRRAVEEMHALGIDVDLREEMRAQERREAARIVASDADELVEVEDPRGVEARATGPVPGDDGGVDRGGGAARRQRQSRAVASRQHVRDHARGDVRCRAGGAFDDNPH